MRTIIHYLQLVTCLNAALALVGCVSTQVELRENYAGTARLTSLARRVITVYLCANSKFEPSQSIGNQFLLLAIPFGNVYVNYPAQTWLGTQLSQEFAVRGFRVRFVESPEKAQVRVCLQGLSLNAFDLLFTRIIAARLSANLILRDAATALTTEQDLEGSTTRFRRFGFSEQLQSALYAASDELVSKIVTATLAQ